MLDNRICDEREAGMMTDAINRLDLRGLSCPQPVMKVRSALQETKDSILEALVDSPVARDNIERACGNLGWGVTVRDTEDGYLLIMTRA